MIYKTFQKVSNVCQLLDKSKFLATQTINGVTFTNNGDGTITVNGTATSVIYYWINRFIDSLYLSHKYLVTGESSGLRFFVENRDENNNILLQMNNDTIMTLPSNTKISTFEYYIKQGTVCDNLVIKPQFFDLTEMYGAGNEPTTVEEFRQDFPEEMYDYSPHCFVKSYRTLLKASDVCQLLDKSKYTGTRTINGVTFTNNGDGTITVNGTATARAIFNIQISNYFPSNLIGHTCLIVPNVSLPTTTGTINIHTTSWEVSNIKPIGKIDIMPDVRISVFPGYTANNLVFKPQFFDLTEMYGRGNEPTTVAQFRQDFPEELYDYKPYSIIPSYKKSLVCTTKNLLPYPYFDGTKTFNGITYTDNGDGTVNLSGTSTSQSNYYFSYKTLNLKKGVTYTLSASGDYSCSGSFTFYIYNSTYGQVCYIPLASSNSASFTPTQDINGINCYIVIPPDRTLNGTFKPMMELGNTATDYVPYGHL